jgi:uncharacterized YceG family protein
MNLFGSRTKRPKAMEWGSSFAEAEIVASRTRFARGSEARYDSSNMGPDQHRPIGSRRIDVTPHELDGGYGRGPGLPPTGGRRGGGLLRRFVNLLLLLAALAIIGAIVWGVWNFANGGSDVPAGRKVVITVPRGADSTKIAGILADKGIVANETVFRARLKLHGDGSQFRSGSYTMKTGSSYDSVVRTLNKGPAAAPTFSLTIPEGQRLEETAATIDKLHDESVQNGGKAQPKFTGAEYLAAARAATVPTGIGVPAGVKTKEGLLFPSTYELKLTDSAQDLVAKQQATFTENLDSLNMARAKKANLTPYDVVIIASLVEREAQIDKERPLVAAVIWNRLKVGEPLGIDASNQYGVYKAGDKEFWTTGLTKSQLENGSDPYNLRKNGGLPPTPIAEPSLKSLQAAANPAKVDYRYYVAKGDGSGSHFFTADYNEFLAHQ